MWTFIELQTLVFQQSWAKKICPRITFNNLDAKGVNDVQTAHAR